MSQEKVDYGFPYQPYKVQIDFMRELCETIEARKIGIFESPTGTGKSLSLLCGSLFWLQREKETIISNLSDSIKELSVSLDISGDNWLRSFQETQEKKEQQKLDKERLEKINQLESKYKKLRDEKQLLSRKSNVHNVISESEFLLNFENELDDLKKLVNSQNSIISKDEDDALLSDYDSDNEERNKKHETVDDTEEKTFLTPQIIFCSRTHSQLAQFVHEIRKTNYADALRMVVLGSRQNTCVNEEVRKLSSLSLMNERCMTMQDSSRRKVGEEIPEKKKMRRKVGFGKCPYYRNIEETKDRILTEVLDIEELGDMGRSEMSCPYYASRRAVEDAELIVVPYNILLHRETRQSCGIRLEENVVIVDEAHNLIETITGTYSASVNLVTIEHAHKQIAGYMTKYRTRLNAKNLMYLKQLEVVLSALEKFLSLERGVNVSMTSTDLMIACGIDHINFFKFIAYCESTKLPHKLHRFGTFPRNNASQCNDDKSAKVDKPALPGAAMANFLAAVKTSKKSQSKQTAKQVQQSNSTENVVSNVTAPTDGLSGMPLFGVLEFLKAVTRRNDNGRILVQRSGNSSECELRYMQLSAGEHFTDIVLQARSVILAGGTMEPVKEVIDQLFVPAGVSLERIHRFSCDHVIPPDNLITIALSQGPTRTALDFTFQNRSTPATLAELGRVLTNLSKIIPGGIVCFFPSYDYEQSVVNLWKISGIFAELEKRRKVFREPKKTSELERVLKAYSDECRKVGGGASGATSGGALLFSVVGGKMSEGINFSDELGRCVVMIGLPFPNTKSLALQEKMKFLKERFGAGADSTYYQNACMKAVNQSVGRAIRHCNDYAVIVLLDQRYHRHDIISSLPRWIQKTVVKQSNFGPAYANICRFFANKRRTS